MIWRRLYLYGGAKWMLLWLDYLKWYALISVSSEVSDFVNAPLGRHSRSQVQEIDLLSGWKLRTILPF